MSVPVGHAGGIPALRPVLESALAELLAHTRAQSVRLIDLAGGRALVTRAARPVVHDPAADLALARLADAAFAVGAADGGYGDLVLAGPRATHVLAPGPYRSVVVLRLGPGSDVGVARRAVLSPRLAAVLRAGHPAAPDRGPAVPLAIPLPRPPGGPVGTVDTGPMRALRAVPAPRAPEPSGPAERQPALAALAAAPFARPTGELAARALGGLVDPPPLADVPLPRRSGRPPLRDEGVLATAWSRDVAVMQRVLEGLRRLA